MNLADEAHFSNISSAHRRWAQLHEFVVNVQFNGLSFRLFLGWGFLAKISDKFCHCLADFPSHPWQGRTMYLAVLIRARLFEQREHVNITTTTDAWARVRTNAQKHYLAREESSIVTVCLAHAQSQAHTHTRTKTHTDQCTLCCYT